MIRACFPCCATRNPITTSSPAACAIFMKSFSWQASRSTLRSALLGGALTAALSRVLCENLIERFQPHVIANTYPLYHPPLASFLKSAQERLPVVTIITDFGSVHTLWYYRSAAACLVATEKVRQQAIGFGLPPENVHVCGIPISPAFSKETRSKDVYRASSGLADRLAGCPGGGERAASRTWQR